MRKTYGRILHRLIAPALEHAASTQECRPDVNDLYVVALGRALNGRNRVSVEEILRDVLKLPVHQWTSAEVRRVVGALRMLGWERKRVLYSHEWYYERPEELCGGRSASISAERVE